MLLERVKSLDEKQAEAVLEFLETQEPAARPAAPKSAHDMLGYALKYNHPHKTTAEWMAELREGERVD